MYLQDNPGTFLLQSTIYVPLLLEEVLAEWELLLWFNVVYAVPRKMKVS